jgi:hypothetical protein
LVDEKHIKRAQAKAKALEELEVFRVDPVEV